MTETEDAEKTKSVGGIAPFGYRWQNGALIVDKLEAQTRKLIYELFIKHKRKKTVAKLLNDLGYRTRNGALFSDTTINRLLRDTTAKGVKTTGSEETAVEAIVSEDVWQRANNLLGQKPTKQPVHLFGSLAFCECGGRMTIPSNTEKYVCLECRHKINADDLEEIFISQLFRFPLETGNGAASALSDYWHDLTSQEKRIIIEQICERITLGAREITIEFVFLPNSLKTAAFGQQSGQGNETLISDTIQSERRQTEASFNEPLMNEIEAAKFLGISRMTLLRKRNAHEVGFYRVGFRVLYSKEKHLLPFLKNCER